VVNADCATTLGNGERLHAVDVTNTRGLQRASRKYAVAIDADRRGALHFAGTW
jgi:hypothetical protein